MHISEHGPRFIPVDEGAPDRSRFVTASAHRRDGMAEQRYMCATFLLPDNELLSSIVEAVTELASLSGFVSSYACLNILRRQG
jgi:hypothetical protein